MTDSPARPTDKPLVWRETKDDFGNSTHEALSITWGDEQGQPMLYWRVRCVLRNNQAEWTNEESDDLLEDEIAIDGAETAEWAMRICQIGENDIRARLGDGLPPLTTEPEEAPAIADEHGFAPTSNVCMRWSRNGGSLRAARVWRQIEPPHLEQERDITDPEEEKAALAGFFTQKMVEELVTRLCTGGFGRLVWETEYATVVLQAELDFLDVSAFTAHVRQGGVMTEIPVKLPTNERIMQVIARQLHGRKRLLEEAIGNQSISELQAEIARNARLLGLDAAPPAPATQGGNGGILPVELGDIHAGGGDVLDPGQKNGRRP